jgi:polyhydroxyalkanoate synthesis repressor PhaR
MTRDGVEFKVLDAKSGEEITHSILTQIIMDEEANGTQMLPVSFLRDLISMYGNSMQAMMPAFLEASMQNFRQNQDKVREAWSGKMDGETFAKIAEANMEMFRAAAGAFIPAMAPQPGKAPATHSPAPSETTGNEPADDLSTLRAQMEAMQKKLDELGK